MNKRSFFEAQTRTVALDDENSIVIRKPKFGERQAAAARIVEQAGSNGAMQSVLLNAEMLKLVIASWSGPGFDGQPVTAEMVDQLPAEVADQVLEAYRSWAEVDDAEKKAFGAATS
ncbi:MAG: hypothetical protein ACOH2M_09755 [Cypionkella sp.]